MDENGDNVHAGKIKAMCEARALRKGGTKATLIARLLAPKTAVDAARKPAKRRRAPRVPYSASALDGAEHVRTFMADHVPEDWPGR